MIATLSRTLLDRAAAWWRDRRPTREAIVVTALLALIFEVVYLAAFFVRSELLLRASDANTILRTIGVVVGVKLLVFYARGLCHRPWRAARFADLSRLLRAATAALLLVVALNYFGQYVSGWRPIPRSVLLLDWAFTLLGVGGMQAVARSVYEEIVPATAVGAQKTVLFVDGSPAGLEIAETIGSGPEARYFVAGVLDDDPDRYGLRFGRAAVLGPVAVAPACAARLRASEIIVRSGSLYGARLRALCDACAALGVRVSIAERGAPADGAVVGRGPGIGRVTVRDLELRDLLSRPEARLDDQDSHVLPFLKGKTVMVTGAGGSIGSEICRQLLRFDPARLVLVERSECGLFSIHRELAESAGAAAELVPVLCDITVPDRIERVFLEHRPQVVFHAAAFKHVPLMESHPVEAIENNTLATAALAEAADAHGVEAFVALSTDKAVHPSSVMGASKLLAERFLQSFGDASATRFVTVRFGNVIGSSGSAVPIFQEQLARRKPITVTHQDVRRYFMTTTEAAQLVLLAGALPGKGSTCVLEMGEPIPIVELVSSIAFVMRVPPHEVRIRFCGLRPGEKLDEELFFEDERRADAGHPLVIRVQRPARPLAEVRQWLAELKSAVAGEPAAAYHAIMDIAAADCSSLQPAPQPAAAPRDALAEQRA